MGGWAGSIKGNVKRKFRIPCAKQILPAKRHPNRFAAGWHCEVLLGNARINLARGRPGANNQFQGGYTYDAAGNMNHDATTNLNYTYDAENRITGAAGYTYTYDGDGNRVAKSNGSSGAIYWYAAVGVVAESDLSGNLQHEYIFFGGQRVARKDLPGNTVSYYFSDHLQRASVITDSAGNIKAESDYYPFGGELQIVNNDSNDYKIHRQKARYRDRPRLLWRPLLLEQLRAFCDPGLVARPGDRPVRASR